MPLASSTRVHRSLILFIRTKSSGARIGQIVTSSPPFITAPRVVLERAFPKPSLGRRWASRSREYLDPTPDVKKNRGTSRPMCHARGGPDCLSWGMAVDFLGCGGMIHRRRQGLAKCIGCDTAIVAGDTITLEALLPHRWLAEHPEYRRSSGKKNPVRPSPVAAVGGGLLTMPSPPHTHHFLKGIWNRVAQVAFRPDRFPRCPPYNVEC